MATPLAHHGTILAGIQRACLHPLLLCLSPDPILCHPFVRFGRHGLIRHASSEQRTIVFLLPRQKPHLCRFTAVPQFWFAPLRRPQRFGPMHEYRPIFLLLIWKQQVASSNYPCTPTFDEYVSCDYSQAFPSSLSFAQAPYPKCKENRQPLYFCLGQEWHPPLHASHLAKLSFCLGVLVRLSAMLLLALRRRNGLVVLAFANSYIAIDCILCHSHHLHQLAFMINGSIDFLPAWDYQHPPRRLSTPFLMLITNSLFVDCFFFALFFLGPSLSTIPHSPLHTLLSEGRLLSW